MQFKQFLCTLSLKLPTTADISSRRDGKNVPSQTVFEQILIYSTEALILLFFSATLFRNSHGKNLLPRSQSNRLNRVVTISPSATVISSVNSPLHFSHLLITNICRHDGHDEWDPSHVSMHPTWNPCPHCGNTLNSSPSMNSVKQIAQSVNFPSVSE